MDIAPSPRLLPAGAAGRVRDLWTLCRYDIETLCLDVLETKIGPSTRRSCSSASFGARQEAQNNSRHNQERTTVRLTTGSCEALPGPDCGQRGWLGTAGGEEPKPPLPLQTGKPSQASHTLPEHGANIVNPPRVSRCLACQST